MSNDDDESLYEDVAGGLRNVGYPGVTAEMIRDVHEAMRRGDDELPHGIVGVFACDWLEDSE